MDCLFCKIAQGKIPVSIIYSDDEVIAFEDINPQAPVHILIIPRRHIACLDDITEPDKVLIGHMTYIATEIARSHTIATTGYRLVLNCNNDGGQTVFHIHLHLLGGRPLKWPPG